MIQQRGDQKPGFSLVESGQAIAGSIGEEGAFLITTILNPGDYFGEFSLFAGLPRMQNLWAVGETVITTINAARFQELYNREPDLSRALLTIALRRIHFMVEFLDGQRRWPLPVRIAHLLLTSVEDKEHSKRQQIRCRQQDLADMLGVSRVAIGKALAALRREGLVVMQYGSIELPDIPRLSAWLKQNYQVEPLVPSPGWVFKQN